MNTLFIERSVLLVILVFFSACSSLVLMLRYYKMLIQLKEKDIFGSLMELESQFGLFFKNVF